MATTVRQLGFSGHAILDGVQVLVTSGNFSRDKTISYVTAMQMANDNISRSKIGFSEGIWIVSGSLSFDLTEAFLNKLTINSFLRRNHPFRLDIYDGYQGWTVGEPTEKNCFYTSLSITGAANGLISCSLNVTSSGDFTSLTPDSTSYLRDESPLAYWQSGNTDVFDWNLTISQEVVPKYMNQEQVLPKYLRVGLWEATLDVSTYEELQPHDEIAIYTKRFTVKGNSTTNGYTFNGQGEFGTYNHRFESGRTLGTGLNSVWDIISVT